jgi:glycosyltransferase involved in cell wall biosynthesis
MTPPDSRPPEVTVLLPCLNEEKTLPFCIEEIKMTFESNHLHGEILVADNGSTDNSKALATSLGARVVDVAEKGYGNALHYGILAARADYVVMGDADGSYNFSHTPALLEKLRDGAHLVMGNRFAGGIDPGAMPWKNKHLGNPALSLIGRVLFNIPTHDFHCGLRGVNKAHYQKLDLNSTGMEYASEMVIKFAIMKSRIDEVPTVLRKDLRDTAPHLRPWRDGWRHLRLMLALAPDKALRIPGWAITILGLLSWAVLLPGTLPFLGVRFDIHSLLFASLLLAIGPMLLFLGSFARIYAIETGLLPNRKSLLQKDGSAEWLSIFGAVCLLAGAVLGGIAVSQWLDQGLGDLDPSRTMRWAIPSATLLQLGAQSLAMSMVVHLIQIPLRSRAVR